MLPFNWQTSSSIFFFKFLAWDSSIYLFSSSRIQVQSLFANVVAIELLARSAALRGSWKLQGLEISLFLEEEIPRRGGPPSRGHCEVTGETMGRDTGSSARSGVQFSSAVAGRCTENTDSTLTPNYYGESIECMGLLQHPSSNSKKPTKTCNQTK